jgi:hypothetical protein
MKGTTKMIHAGSTVRVSALPGRVAQMPFDSQRVFQFCLGRTYQVVEKDQKGLCVLDLSRDLDQRFIGMPSNIRVETECLEEVRLRFVSDE